MKKISIDATIVNSLIGSRFNHILRNEGTIQETNLREEKNQQPKTTMLDKYRQMD
jgi:hypothetical protein